MQEGWLELRSGAGTGGVGTRIIADHDIITESNLNRQYFFYDQIGQTKAVSFKRKSASG